MLEASNLGEIRSRFRVLKAPPGRNGYRKTAIGENPTVSVYVHHSVAEAFLGPRPNGMQIRHLDGDKLNNRVGNLRYGTPSENVRDVLRHGRHFQANQTHCIHGHEFTPENTYVSPSTGGRVCLACKFSEETKEKNRVRARAYYRKNRARLAAESLARYHARCS